MDEIWKWLQSLDPNFALLLALPFLVFASAWLSEIIRNKLRSHQHQ
jgi:hypothetical protein